MWLNIEQYIYGSITLAVIAGGLAFGITWLILETTARLRVKAEEAKN